VVEGDLAHVSGSTSAEASSDRPLVLILGGFLPPPYGGIAKYMKESIPRVLQAGWRVMNVQPPAPAANPLFTDRPGYRTDLVRRRFPAALLRLALREPRVFAELLRLTAPVRRLGVGRHTALLAWIAAWYEAGRRVVDREPVAVIHAYDTPWLQGVAGLLLARRCGARFLMTTFGEVLPHSDELVQLEQGSDAYAPLVRHVLDRADTVASMTEHCANQVAHAGWERRRVEIVPLVLGMRSFHPGVDGADVRARHAPSGEPLLLFVGQVRPRKGPQTLLPALAAVRAGGVPARLLLVGPDHGFAGELRTQAEALGVAEHVVFTGTVSDDELPRYYAACDVFLFPTCTAIECLGLSFVQAMFSGKPVIATRIAGAPEVIRDGVDGWLVEPNAADAFADRILALLRAPAADREALGRAAHDRAHALYDEEKVLGDLLRTYERLRAR
jgi:glycosyltransferase involved in cell wall biosynthesis